MAGWVEGFPQALERVAKAHKGTSGKPLPVDIREPYICQQLGLNPAELRQLDYETVEVHLGWADGVNLANWVATHPLKATTGQAPKGL